MEIYLLLFNVTIVLGIAKNYNDNQKSNKTFCNIVLVLIVLVQGLRSISIGEDSIVYVTWFYKYISMNRMISFKDILLLDDGVDLGYKIINVLISFFTFNYHALFFVVSTLIWVLLIKFIQKNVANSLLGILLIFSLNFFLTSMVSLRQFIALSIVIWQLPYYLKRQYPMIIILSLLGFLFHDTSLILSLVLLFSYILVRLKINPLFIFLCFIFVFVFKEYFVKLASFLIPGLQYYDIFREKIVVSKIRILLNFIELFTVLYVYKKNIKSEKNLIVVNILCFSIICGFLDLFISYMFRINYYFDFFLIVLIPEIVCFNKNKNHNFSFIFLVSLCFVFFSYYLSYNPGNTVPYKFFFNR